MEGVERRGRRQGGDQLSALSDRFEEEGGGESEEEEVEEEERK